MTDLQTIFLSALFGFLGGLISGILTTIFGSYWLSWFKKKGKVIITHKHVSLIYNYYDNQNNIVYPSDGAIKISDISLEVIFENESERPWNITDIKVHGFYDKEPFNAIFKENGIRPSVVVPAQSPAKIELNAPLGALLEYSIISPELLKIFVFYRINGRDYSIPFTDGEVSAEKGESEQRWELH